LTVLNSYNTKFFHAWANHRRRTNQNNKIRDEEGNSWTKHDDIGGAFLLYFQQLFTSSRSMGLQDCLAVVQPRVTQAMNDSLLRTFSPKDMDTALSHMHPLKAPGPDGFGVCFYQQHWNTVGGTDRKVVLDCLNLGFFDNSINSTYIALIPKISHAAAVSEFQQLVYVMFCIKSLPKY